MVAIEPLNRSIQPRIPSILPKVIIKLWNGWEIRTLVLLSFFFQIILILFGWRRKYICRRSLYIIIWLFYVSADWIATVALANLARREADTYDQDSKPYYNTIQAFWAPFLLLHLGGPDTITSYSLEDNNLWLRHLLGLVVEVTIALYAYFGAWIANHVTFAAIPVFLSGLIKYGERTWALKSSTSKSIKRHLVSAAVKNSKDTNDRKKVVPRKDCPDASTHYLHRSYYLYKMSLYLFSDLILGFSELTDSHSIISSVKSPKEAFELVEVELGLIYDRLYTKAIIAQSWVGLILRCFSFFSLFTALILFSIVIFHYENSHHSRVDIVITYILLVGGLFLEVYAFVNLILSDWTMIWLVKKSGNPPSNFICRFIFSLHEYFNKGKRWSGSMAQYNLISCCLQDESKYMKLFCIDKIMKSFYMDVNWKDVNVVPDLKESIFRHLLRKGNRIIKIINGEEIPIVDDEDEPIGPHDDEEEEKDEVQSLSAKLLKSFSVFQKQSGKELRDSLLSVKRPQLQKEKSQSDEFEFDETVSLNHNIIIWHIATDLCYYSDLDNAKRSPLNPKYEISKRLSQYMFYLLVKRSKMLPRGDRSTMNAYQDTQRKIKLVLKGKCKSFSYSHKEACKKLLQTNLSEVEDEKKEDKSLLNLACRLAKELHTKKFKEKWDAISEVWIEMVVYAANHYEWRYHAQQLTKGGEFLTHVCLLMTHLGLSEQFQEFDFRLQEFDP